MSLSREYHLNLNVKQAIILYDLLDVFLNDCLESDFKEVKDIYYSLMEKLHPGQFEKPKRRASVPKKRKLCKRRWLLV